MKIRNLRSYSAVFSLFFASLSHMKIFGREEKKIGAGELSQRLRAMVALPEDLSWILFTN